MRRVAIIGAGELGGALAQRLAARERVGEVRLIDRSGSVAAGKALDIRQSGSIDSFDTRVTAADTVAAAAGAAVIVLADPAGAEGTATTGDAGFLLLRQLARLDATSPIVCADAGQRELIERGVNELGIPRTRLIGSAPLALASALRALVALAIDGSAADVTLAVLGIPPRAIVPWSDASVAGRALTATLAPHEIAALNDRLKSVWPPAPYALASAAARISEAIACGSRRSYPCFVTLDGEWGTRGRTAAAIVELGANGVRRIIDSPMTVQERVALENVLQSG
jgi:malate dehydrogenase